MSEDISVSEGELIFYEPENGGTFPTGESKREAEVEDIRGDEIVVRQTSDGFTQRITEDQIVDNSW